MTMYQYIKKLSTMDKNERQLFVENLIIQNYGSNELTETEIWILSNASKNEQYLKDKLQESENEISLDTEAPEEVDSSTPVVQELDTEELKKQAEEEEQNTDLDSELSLDDTDETSEEEQNTDLDSELSLDDTDDENDNATINNETKEEIETSKEGIGILPLLGEIQSKLAKGKPSAVELAAIKALRKLIH